MKTKIGKHILACTAALLALLGTLSSCTDDLLLESNEADGTPVKVSVGMALPEPGERNVLTRAVDGKLVMQIYDLVVFAFDNTGKLTQRYYFHDIDTGTNTCDVDASTNPDAKLIVTQGSNISKLENMTVSSGRGYLMAVANAEVKSAALLQKLMALETRDELLGLYARDSHYASDASILSGAYMEKAQVSMAEFNPSGEVVFRSGTLAGRIHMLSTTAAVQFNINGKGSGSAGGSFILDSYEFVNLPGWTPIISEIGNPLSVEEARKHVVNSGELAVFEEKGAYKYAFDFEVLEYKGTGSESIQKYGDRAQWNEFSGNYKNFTNAPELAPYVILRGTYAGKSKYVNENGEEKEGNVMADVEYYIFLGHDSGLNTPEGLRDFSTLRNWQYVYNITINGIHDITVEVNRKDDHWRDDVEGDVIVMESEGSIRFDSHYCQATFELTVGEIRKLHQNNLLGFRVIAPGYGVDKEMFLKKNDDGSYVNENSDGWNVHDEITGNVLSGSTEYYKKKGYMDMNNIACLAADWIRFYRYSDAEISQDDWLINYSDKLKSVNGSNNPNLLTIYRFLWSLQSIALNTTTYNDVNKKIKFAVFVQENHYENNWNDCMLKKYGNSTFDPRAGNTAAPNALPSNPILEKNVHWSQFVNVSDRKILLFPVTRYANDAQASYSNPQRVFAQRSIRTIYKPTTGFKAWGTESVEEYIQSGTAPSWYKGSDWTSARKMVRVAEHNSSTNKRVPFASNQNMSGDSLRYSRAVSYRKFKNKRWSEFITYNSKYLNQNYRISGNVLLNSNGSMADMIASCLGRNRDLNGDGKIDASEIRWYVPGISQLQALYVGNVGLPTEARLYQQEANDGKWVYKHYMSATLRYDETTKKFDGTNSILWAEEGPSTGQIDNSYAYGLHVRCVRDLGTDLNKEIDEWSGFYEKYNTSSANTAGYIDIDKLNDNCVRLALENRDQSGVITTFSNENRPAKAFYYANKVINKGPTKTFSYTNGNSYTIPDWTSPLLIGINEENQKSEGTPQRRSLCAQNFGQGWRTPTITEVAIMYWAGVFPRTENVLSRTRYVFWQQTNRGGIDLINNSGNDTSGRDPHSFSEGEFRLRYPWVNIVVPTTQKAGNVTQISGHYGGILCVKDKF